MLLRSTAASISRSASGFVRPTAAVRTSAPTPARSGFRPPLPVLAVLAYASASSVRIEVCCPTPAFHVRPFVPLALALLWPRLTSGDPSQHLSMPVAQGRPPDLPGYCALTFTLMPVGSTSRRSVQELGFASMCPLTPAVPPLSASCSSGQRFAFGFLQIPPRDGHPCRSANTSPCRVCRGLAPPSKCALPGAHTKKEAPHERVPPLPF